MRWFLVCLTLAVAGCSSDSTGASSDSGVTITVAAGTAYTGHAVAATVTNTTAANVAVRALDCGSQVERLDDGHWTSFAPAGTLCSAITIAAGGSQVFSVNIPSTAGAGTFRVTSAIQAATGETAIHSGNFAVIVPPYCETTPPPAGVICIPR